MVASNGSQGSSAGKVRPGIFDRLFRRALTPAHATIDEACSIALASGKGGTGKSFLATNLAVLAAPTRSVTLVDCDFGLACDHLLLGVNPRTTLQHVVSGRSSLDDVRTATAYGVSLIPGGSGVRHMAELKETELVRMGASLGEAAASTDVLLLDVGAGITPQELLVLLCVDEVVLVTQPEIAAMTDAYAVVKCLSQLGCTARLHVVVNRTTAPGQGVATYEKLSEVSGRYVGTPLHYLGEVGDDPAVTQRRLGQPPLTVSDPGGDTSTAIRRILQRLEEVGGPVRRRPVADGDGIAARFARRLRSR